jgi:hypothetical protein
MMFRFWLASISYKVMNCPTVSLSHMALNIFIWFDVFI